MAGDHVLAIGSSKANGEAGPSSYWCHFSMQDLLDSAWMSFAKMMSWAGGEEEEPFDLSLLSTRQLRQLKWAFNVLDEDGSGFIQGNELVKDI